MAAAMAAKARMVNCILAFEGFGGGFLVSEVVLVLLLSGVMVRCWDDERMLTGAG